MGRLKDFNKLELFDMATRFCVSEAENINVELRNPSDRARGWAVTRGGSELNKRYMEFEYCPLPSSRDALYLEEHRMSLDEALNLGFSLVEKKDA